MRRRALLGSMVALGTALSGCNTARATAEPAHTVSVYLGEREANRDVNVMTLNKDGSTLFERSYELSDSNEAHEDATFPESTDPHTIAVTVDGTQFEEPWPPFALPQRECTEPNWEGVEIWIEGSPDESPSIRITGNCQHVTVN